MKLTAIILAAGEGRRIGGPKALLQIEDTTFLARCVERLARPAISEVIAVIGHEAERVRSEVRLPASAVMIDNPSYRDGMLGSIRRGLDEAEARGAHAVLIHPVDHPLIEASTVDRVVAALHSGAVIAVPTHDGKRGHPAGFAKAAWDALRQVSADRGARGVLADHPEWIVHLPGDIGCVTGIDTREDYRTRLGANRGNQD